MTMFKPKSGIGSTFKPFVYATAINLQGISPCFTVYDQPQTIAPGDGNFGLLRALDSPKFGWEIFR
ncbi:MAG: hypothetical protein R2784_07405 [Saprospiraceae bacterium]